MDPLFFECKINEKSDNKKEPLRLFFCVKFSVLFLLAGFFHQSIETGLFASGGVSLDDFLLSGFVEGFDSLLQLLLCFVYVACSDSFAGLFDGALYDTVHDFVAERILGGDAHVLLG